MDVIISTATAVLLILIGIIIRQAIRIGTLESSLKNEDKCINDIHSKLNRSQQEHDETISRINEKHLSEIASLNNEISELKKTIDFHHSKPLNYPKQPPIV